MVEKEGQLQISFGMIFSIIIIIAVIAVSWYAISYFVNLSTCSSIGLFYDAIQKDIDTAWQGTSSRTLFQGNVPGSVNYMCFGNMSSAAVNNADRERFEELKKTYRLSQSNVFVYPQKSDCGTGITNHRLNHLSVREFFCIQEKSGTIKAVLSKNNFDAAVTVSSP